MGDERTYRDERKDNIGVLERAIAESDRTRDALIESEQKFRSFADSTPIAIMMYQDDRWIFVNKASEEITGYTSSELLSKNFWDIVHPDYRERARANGRRRQTGDASQDRYDLKVVTKGGDEKWVFVTGSSTQIKGRPAGVISASDITERKKKDEALARSMERLEIISSTASQLLFSKDPQKMIDALCQKVMEHLDC